MENRRRGIQLNIEGKFRGWGIKRGKEEEVAIAPKIGGGGTHGRCVFYDEAKQVTLGTGCSSNFKSTRLSQKSGEYILRYP